MRALFLSRPYHREVPKASRAVQSLLLAVLAACSDGSEPPSRATPSPTATRTQTAPGTPAATPSPGWRTIASAPLAVQEVAAAIAGTRIYVAGGLLADRGVSRDVLIYDIATNRWSRGPDLPIAVHHPAGAVFEGKFMVIGGLTSSGAASDRTFFLAGAEWIEGPRLAHKRGAAAAVAIGDKVVVVGGVDGPRQPRETEIFDGQTWSDGALMPTKRDHLAVATDGRLLYAAGGRSGGRSLDAFEVYDLASNRWRALRDVPTARSGFGAAFVAGRVVTAGGEAPGIFANVEAYDPAAGTWSALAPMPTPRHGHGVAAYQRTMFTLVGGDVQGLAPTAVCEALTL